MSPDPSIVVTGQQPDFITNALRKTMTPKDEIEGWFVAVNAKAKASGVGVFEENLDDLFHKICSADHPGTIDVVERILRVIRRTDLTIGECLARLVPIMQKFHDDVFGKVH